MLIVKKHTRYYQDIFLPVRNRFQNYILVSGENHLNIEYRYMVLGQRIKTDTETGCADTVGWKQRFNVKDTNAAQH